MLKSTAPHQGLRVELPSGSSYWTVVDHGFEVVEPLDAYLQFGRFGQGLSLGTTRVYAGNLSRLADWGASVGCELGEMPDRLPSFVMFLRSLRTERAGSGQGRPLSEDRLDHVLTTARSFLVWAARSELVAREKLSRLFEVYEPGRFSDGYRGELVGPVARPVHRMKVTRLRVPRAVTEAEFVRLFDAALEARDRFLLVLLRFAGLRIGEALGLLRSDLHLAEDSQELGCPVAGPHLHVVKREEAANGAEQKSARDRVVPLNVYVLRFYWLYLEERIARGLGDSCDFVFVNYGRPAGAPMQTGTARKRLARLARRAEITRRLTPHMLRHSFAVGLRRHKTDLRLIQGLLGHASITSTAMYAHPEAEELRAAVEAVGVPSTRELERGLTS